MTLILHIYEALSAKPWMRFVAGVGLGLLIWTFSSKALSDIVVYGAFLFALFHTERGLPAWKQPAGIAFIILLVHHLVLLPFSVSPEMSIHDTEGLAEILAGIFAIPVIFNDRQKISNALFYSAAAITLTLAYDLARMTFYLGPNILAKAHSFQPFIMNHSNVASMMAGLSFFVFLFFAARGAHGPPESLFSDGGRRTPCDVSIKPQKILVVAGCVVGCAVCLAYLVIAASRGPQIAFAFAFACAGFILPGRRKKIIWLLAVIIFGAIVFAGIEHINPRFAEKSSMKNFSERDKVWKHTWELAMERKWFGYGYGKRNFEMNYYASQPQPARFHFPHCHQYWLKLLFEYGWTGLCLYAAAWLILAAGLLRRIYFTGTLDERLLPGVIALMLLFVHFYGMYDYPDNLVQIAQFWLVPAALVVMKCGQKEKTENEND